MPTSAEHHAPGVDVVFIITRGDSVGGAQIHVRDLSVRLQSDGLKTLVLTGNRGTFTADLEARGVPWRVCPALARSINPARDFQAVREIRRVLLAVRPRLVSTHTAKAGLVGRLAAAWARVPVVFTAHGWQFSPGIPPTQRILVYALELLLARLPGPSRVITVSRFDFRLARRSAAVPSQRLRLVYNGLPDKRMDKEAPVGNVTSRYTPTRLVMIARFQAQKDHATLVRALAELPGPWILQLVGEDGPFSASIRDLVTQLELTHSTGKSSKLPRTQDMRHVEFLGHQRDIEELLAAADIYCLVTNWEGLPRSIIEAMRAGLPVVATDVGGVTELVRDGITGRVTGRGEVKELACALLQLIRDRDKRARMGMEGRRRYENLFTFEAMYRKTRTVWREIRDDTP